MTLCKCGCGRDTENINGICEVCESEFKVCILKMDDKKLVNEAILKPLNQISIKKILFVSIHRKRFLIILFDRLVISSVSGIWRCKL